jgi:hypothetical protein
MELVAHTVPLQLDPSGNSVWTHWDVVVSQVSTVHGSLSSQEAGQAGLSIDGESGAESLGNTVAASVPDPASAVARDELPQAPKQYRQGARDTHKYIVLRTEEFIASHRSGVR